MDISTQSINQKKIESNYNQQVRKLNYEHQKKISKIKTNNEKDIDIETSKSEQNIYQFQNRQKNRLERIREHYSNSLKVMKKRFDQELNRLKKNVLASKTKIYGDEDDAFKDRVELKTDVKNYDKYVEVIVHIPKALSSNLFTSIDQRDVKINLSRSYDDEYVENDERIRFNKNQTVTKELKVADILKESNLTKIIMDNKTIFKIEKA